ncbi:TPA: hypothetical protein R3V32_004303 [Enterobacter cloacae]|nr:hypothetical protein [Enterobacter cloacae]
MRYYIISDDVLFSLGIQAYYHRRNRMMYVLGCNTRHIEFFKHFFNADDFLFISVENYELFCKVQKALMGCEVTIVPVLSGARIAQPKTKKFYIEKNASLECFWINSKDAIHNRRSKFIRVEGLRLVMERVGGDAAKNISIGHGVSQNHIYKQTQKLHDGYNIKAAGYYSLLLCYRLLLLNELYPDNCNDFSYARRDALKIS